MKNRMKCFLLLPIIIFLFGGCAQVEEYAKALFEITGLIDERTQAQVEKITMNGLDVTAVELSAKSESDGISFESPYHSTYAYDTLNEVEKAWYNNINAALAICSEEAVTLSQIGLENGLDEEDVDRIYQCVLIDHPEYFYVEGYEYTRYSALGKTVGIEICGTYELDREECIARKEQLDAAVEQILQKAPVNSSDYDKIKYVYETIIYNTEYRMDASDNQNIYSVFIGRASVCQGYAKAVQYLLNCLDVECTLVFGEVNNGEGHSWNLVKSGEQYYYLDATWGDASYLTEEGSDLNQRLPDINYDYLCITTEQLIKTHFIDHELDLPECTALEDNYYIREGSYFTGYDEAQLKREFGEAVNTGEGYVTLKCDNRQTYDSIYAELIGNQKVFEYLGDSYETIAYIENGQQLSLTFWMTNQ